VPLSTEMMMAFESSSIKVHDVSIGYLSVMISSWNRVCVGSLHLKGVGTKDVDGVVEGSIVNDGIVEGFTVNDGVFEGSTDDIIEGFIVNDGVDEGSTDDVGDKDGWDDGSKENVGLLEGSNDEDGIDEGSDESVCVGTCDLEGPFDSIVLGARLCKKSSFQQMRRKDE
jgi:hypothetical protein